MQCPTCQTPLREEACAGQRIDRCAECGGLWLDQGELGPVVRSYAKSVEASAQVPATRPDYPCPKCGKLMDRREYAHDSGVFLQRCDDCQGHWIEGWQMPKLEEYVEGNTAVDRLATTLGKQIQSERRLGLIYSLLTSKLLSGAVAAAVAYVLPDAFDNGGLFPMHFVRGYVVVPLLCIWFPEELARMTSMRFGLTRPQVTNPTPGVMLAVCGWILLLTPVLVWMLL
ncbi:zf-TFIIB domain-containing protein [Aeoliella sp. ICT_H6.2]|uniref:Zf-TFIIB domain-containing protein n=1 Tax=Aeoliella straminimaris TaxID=2954799 RepID=A0A9X2F893_9BACT|nr:zf-TFIIB domain-containing protein [Aeoliella straminimaris]MCO6043478.1 zf-TFIIB domain-containing protein [Aeoliella straminimaris]